MTNEKTKAVFISYSHADSKFVERLVRDLQYSNIPATYDRWVLRIGDSIINKIAETVTAASHVIVVISSNSINSNWVQKELAIAMTNEINNGNVKVLPVLIENCQLPAALSDKLYANCEGFRYYSGLRDLIETIEPRDRYDQVAAKYHDLSDPMESALALERALSSDDLNAVRDFLRTRPHLLVCLFGRMWDLSEAIDDFKLCEPHHFVDYLIANGQSYGFEFHVVHLGPLSWLKEYSEEVRRYADGLENFIREARKNYSEFSRAATIRFSDEQISPRFAWQEDDRQHEIRGTLLVGRRREHEDDHNVLRNAIYLRTHGLVEVASYDRLLNAVKKFDNSRSRPEVPGVWERPRTLGPMRHKDD